MCLNEPSAPEAFAKLSAYLAARYASELAEGWLLSVDGTAVSLRRATAAGTEEVVIDLPPHLRPVLDAEEWYRQHQAGLIVIQPGRGTPAVPEPVEPQPDLFGVGAGAGDPLPR